MKIIEAIELINPISISCLEFMAIFTLSYLAAIFSNNQQQIINALINRYLK